MSRPLPLRANLEWLKKLSKERLQVRRAHNPSARLSEAQLAVAREFGFASWRKLKAHVKLAARRSMRSCLRASGAAPGPGCTFTTRPGRQADVDQRRRRDSARPGDRAWPRRDCRHAPGRRRCLISLTPRDRRYLKTTALGGIDSSAGRTHLGSSAGHPFPGASARSDRQNRARGQTVRRSVEIATR